MKNKFVIDQLELIRKSQIKIHHAIIGIKNYQNEIDDVINEINHYRWSIVSYLEAEEKNESKSLS